MFHTKNTLQSLLNVHRNLRDHGPEALRPLQRCEIVERKEDLLPDYFCFAALRLANGRSIDRNEVTWIGPLRLCRSLA